MRYLKLAFVVLVTSQLSIAIAAKPEGQKRGEFLRTELGLSDDQVEKVKEIRGSGRQEVRAAKANFEDTKKAFREAIKNPLASRQELTQKFEAFRTSRDDFQKKRFEIMMEMRSVLKPEQISKFDDLKKQKRGKKKKHQTRRTEKQ